MKRLHLHLSAVLLLLFACGALAQSDVDGDGVDDSIDLCPDENASLFDADGDGCPDTLRNARHVEYWDLDELPLEYFVHEDGLPGISDGSDTAAVQAGFAAWQTPEIGLTATYMGTTADAETNGMDGLNTISFADPNYLTVFGTSVLAVGLTTSFEAPTDFLGQPVRPGQIVDADMLFSTSRSFRTDTQGSGPDLHSVVTHEAGHLFGLSHGAIPTSTMFPALPAGLEARSLTTDDLVAAFMAAPEAGALAAANRLVGSLSDGSTAAPLAGALIFVLDAATGAQIASNYTLPDGSWQFAGLPDGEYFVHAHPLDGSAGANNLVGGYVNALVEGTAQTNFLPDYWDEDESTDEDREAKTAIALNGGSIVDGLAIVSNVDALPPTIVEFRPADASADIRADTVILVRFDEAIEFDTATSRFRLERASDSVGVAGSLSQLSEGSVLIFDPSGRLADATEYRLILSAGIEDRFDNPTASESVITFTTAPAPPPQLSSASPLYIVEGTTLVLSGQGFDASSPANNTVFFGGIAVTPSFASAASLVVEVPAGLAVGSDVSVFVRRSGQPDSNQITLHVTSQIEIARGTPEGGSALAGTPRRLALLPDANFAYVAHSSGVASVVVSALQADYRGVTEVGIGIGTDDVAVHPDGRRVYAIASASQSLFAINSDYVDIDARDPQFNTVLDEIPMGATPRALTISPDGSRAFVVSEGGLVQVWDLQLGSATFHQLIGEIQTPSIDLAPVIGFDRTGTRLVVGSADGRLFVYGADGLTLASEIATAADPRDIAFDPASAVAYVTHGGGDVSIVSLNSNQVLSEASLGGDLFGLGVSPAGLLAYVANRSGDTLDVLDLNPDSPGFRLRGSQFEIGGDPVDVAVSPDGLRVYALEASSSELRVLGIGFGPVIDGITPTYAQPGDIVTIWGQGFGQQWPNQGAINFSNVFFGDIQVTPTHSTPSTLWVTVPEGWNGESVRVSFIGPAAIGFPDELLSNPVNLRRFAGADPVPPVGQRSAFFTKALTLDSDVGGGGLAEGSLDVSNDGTIAVTATGGSIDIHDGVPSSPTFMHVLASFDTAGEAGGVVEQLLVVPGSNLIVVGYFGSGVITVIDGMRGSPTFGQKLGNFAAQILPSCFVVGPMVATPDGKTLIVADGCEDQLAKGGLEIGQTNFLTLDLVGPSIGDCTDLAMHPTGLAAYAAAAGDIWVVDLDPTTENYFNAEFFPVQDIVTSVDVSPDGQTMYVMASEGGGTPHTLETLDLTALLNPSNQGQIVIEANGSGGEAKISLSPQGRYGIISLGDLVAGGLLYDFQTFEELARYPFEGDTLLPYGMDWWPDARLFAQSPWYAGSASVWAYRQGTGAIVLSGGDQVGVAGLPLAAPISIVIKDGLGSPAGGTLVELEVTGGGGILGNGGTHQVFLTDAAGRFSFDWTMGPQPDIGDPVNTVRYEWFNGTLFGDLAIESIADPNAVPISLASVLPSNLSSNVAATTSVQAIFSRAVDPATITEANFALLGPSATAVAGNFGFADGGRRISFLPAEPLAASTSYSIVLSAGILDLDGNPLSNPTTSVFETQAPPDLRMAAISPPAAVAGSFVSISGAGFDPVPAGNIVSFGGIPMPASGGTSTSLRVLVPFDAPSGPVTVAALAQTSNALNFGVLVPSTSAIDEVLSIVDTGATVRSIAITLDGRFAYSVSTEADQVLPVELETFIAEEPIAVGNGPVAIAMHPDGTRAYVANQLSDDVSVIDLTTNTVVTTIAVGDSPVDLVAAPAGDRIYVVNSADQNIAIIDVEAANASFHTVLGVIPTGATTKGAAITPDGTKLYLGAADGFIIVSLDPNDYGVLGVIPTGATTKGAAITPDGTLLILVTEGGDVLVVDITPEGGNAVLGVIPTGATTKGAAITPDGTLLYIIPEVGDEILVVEISYLPGVSKSDGGLGSFSFNILGTTTVGEDVNFLVFDPTGSGRAVAAGGNSGLLNIIDDDPLCLPAELTLEPRSETEPHRGRWILGYVEFPPDRDVKDVDLSTVFLNGTIPCVPDRIYYDDIDNDGIDEAVFSFERLLFQDEVAQGEAVEVHVTGNFISDGRPFCSSDTIRTQRPLLLVPECGDVWSPDDKVTINWISPQGVDTDIVDLLYSVDDGENWLPMLLGEWDDGSAQWTVPDMVSTTVLRIAIIGYDKDKDDYGMYLLDCRGSVVGGVVPVAMSSVRVDIESGAGVLRWETLGDVAVAGFFVLRAEAAEGPFTRLTENPLQGAAKAEGLAFEFRDADIDANRSYWYRLDEVEAGFRHGPYELHWTLASALHPNAPNPFNPRTKIHFAIGQPGRTRLAIYDLRGRQVRVLLDTPLRAREYDVVWDGLDAAGRNVASGNYIYKLSAPGFEQSKKMTLVR